MNDAPASSRILTLVFTDLADSTALKAQRGDQVVSDLLDRHRTLVRRMAAQCGGRIIDWAGDGCFLTFESSSAAVVFALQLQLAHAEAPDLPRVRTGLHMGEVGERHAPDGDSAHPRVEGLVVDLAARIAGLAGPGQILMSAAVADNARQRMDNRTFAQSIQWMSHGRYALKGIDEALEIREVGLAGSAPFGAPAAGEKARPAGSPRSTILWRRTGRVGVIAALLGVLALLPLRWPTTSAPHTAGAPASAVGSPPGRKSIAVLPFVNMSSDKENEYFSDGITEDLISALSKVSGLRVAATTSSFVFKGRKESIESIGAQLHVDAVLEGSVSKVGNQVRITAQLINIADGYLLWSDSYDRELQDIFAIRSEVAQTVVQALEVTLTAGERQKIEQKPTEDVEAYDLYLKGRHAAAAGLDPGSAMRFLQQAIARDPSYALAYNGLAYYYLLFTEWLMPGNESLPRAREAAEKALQFDPSLAEAHVWLGFVHWLHDRDYPAARREFQTALTMQPESATAHELLGWYLGAMGEVDEGLAELRHAVELDPLSSEINMVLGFNLYFARHYEEAIKQLRTTIAINPDYVWTHVWLGRAYARMGRFAEAVAALKAAAALPTVGQTSAISEIEAALGRAYADAGERTEATRMLARLRERARTKFVSAAYLATIHIGLGELDEAFAALARAEAERSYMVGFWKLDPELDPLRSDPRFTALLNKVGLEP